MVRAIASPRQLEEVMTNFWFNHFNVYARKNFSDLLVGNYENQIRNYALGNFRDLLDVTAKHPAIVPSIPSSLNVNVESNSTPSTKSKVA